MTHSSDPSAADRLVELAESGAHESAVDRLERFESASADERKAAIRALRAFAEERSDALEPLLPALSAFLRDEARPVRLTTAKLFVAVAASDPSAVVPAVQTLADRLADDDEFYYVRARAAEALGYVALEHPDAVASPEVLADLSVGLSFDEPEVREKLAKALELVALGNPRRLRHRTADLASHLGDGELVRYHLLTALVVVGCDDPSALVGVRDALTARLDDESPHVRGRAAEALGLLARADAAGIDGDDGHGTGDGETEGDATGSSATAALASLADDEEAFVAERARFALDAFGGGRRDDASTGEYGVGTVNSIRGSTDEIVEAIRSPDGDGECPHCGLALPEVGPPMCPRCGAPR